MWLIFNIVLWPSYVSKENTDLCSASIDAQSLAPWNLRWPKYWWLTKSMLAGYVPIEWNFTLCMMLLAPSTADLIENSHKTVTQSCLLLPFPAVTGVCLNTAMIHDCNHGTCRFLTYDLAVALIFWQVSYSLKWFVLVSSQCHSKGSGGAVVLGMRAGETSPPNSPFIIFSIHSHSVWLMPPDLGRDFPSVYVETKLSAM